MSKPGRKAKRSISINRGKTSDAEVASPLDAADRPSKCRVTVSRGGEDDETSSGRLSGPRRVRVRGGDSDEDCSKADAANATPNALAASVLVLNRFYLAVHVVNVRRAFGLLYRELAEVLDIEDGQYANYDFATWLEMSELRSYEERRIEDDWVQSVSFEIQVPRVIRLLRYDRVPRQTMRFNRRSLFARDGHRCQYCGTTPPSHQLSLDHVVPRSRGGDTSWENVVCCCVRCNTRKGGRTPQEARMTLLKAPRRPSQSPLLLYKLNNPKYQTWRSFLGIDATPQTGEAG